MRRAWVVLVALAVLALPSRSQAGERWSPRCLLTLDLTEVQVAGGADASEAPAAVRPAAEVAGAPSAAPTPALRLLPGMASVDAAVEAGAAARAARVARAARLETAGTWTMVAGAGLAGLGLGPLLSEAAGSSACTVVQGTNPYADCGVSRATRQRAAVLGLGGLAVAIVGLGLREKAAQLGHEVVTGSAPAP